MQDPNTGELKPIPGDDPKNAPPDWQTYAVGGRIKARGWWWEITDIRFDEENQGQLVIKPLKRAHGNPNEDDDPRSTLAKLCARPHSLEDEQRAQLEELRKHGPR